MNKYIIPVKLMGIKLKCKSDGSQIGNISTHYLAIFITTKQVLKREKKAIAIPTRSEVQNSFVARE